MQVIVALPQLIEKALIVRPQDGDNIQLHTLARVGDSLQLVRITVEKRDSDQRDPWNRFYDIKGIEIESAQDSPARAHPQGDGSYFVPGREVSLRELAEVVKRVEDGTPLARALK